MLITTKMVNKIPLQKVEADLYDRLADKTLSFGCKVYCSVLHDTKVKGIFDTPVGDAVHIVDQMILTKNGLAAGAPDGTIKIIGHEPTLNDVLLKLAERKEDGCGVSIECDGLIVSDMFLNTEDVTPSRLWRIKYDLTLSFDNQTEETKRAIHKLLCK